MNGVKSSGGSAGGAGPIQWKVGFVNLQGKYLTAETFGFKINASGTTLRKKQLWTIEQDPAEDDTIYIRSHLGRYLSGDKRGNASCSAEEKTGSEKFVLRYAGDGSGKWAVSNRATGYFLGGTEDQIQCYEKQPGSAEWWGVHLAIHPQVNLRNLNRQKYARLDRNPTPEGRLQVTGVIPWGESSLITFEYVDGKYRIKTSDGRFLHRDGSLVDQPQPETLFSIEIKSGQLTGMAFKDSDGKYITAVGRDAVMQTRNKTVSKDELFVIEDSQPQVYFVAHNGKMVSTRQGIDVTANQEDEVTDKETFQVEFDPKADQLWRIRTADDKYWALEQQSGGIQSIGNGQSANGTFTVEWQPSGALAFKASNGRYVTARMNGSLYAVSDSPTEKELFYLTITNRPSLVLKCEYGFVGFRNNSNPRYECNRTGYDVIQVEHAVGKSADYYLKGHNGKYLSVDAEGNLNADQSEPWPFFLELRGQSKMAIRTTAAPGPYYIRGEQNGTMNAKSADLQKATLWEY